MPAPARRVRPARLPPDPARPSSAWPTGDARRDADELRVDEPRHHRRARRSCSGAGLTAITGETGAGKTLLVEALELLLGGRADAALVRARRGRGARRRPVRDPATTEVVLARVVPRDGRSRAYVDGRLATVGELAERAAARWSTCTASTRTSRCSLPRRSARAARPVRRCAGARRPLAATRAARRASPRVDAELDALGGDARARAREIDLLRFQVDEIDAAEIADPTEDVALGAGGGRCSPTRSPHREAPRARLTRRSTAPALDAVGRGARRARPGAAPFAELAARLRRRSGRARRHRTASCDVAASGSTTIPSGSTRCGRAASCSASSAASTATRSPTSSRFGADGAARLDELEGYEVRAAELDAGARAIARRTSLAAAARARRRSPRRPRRLVARPIEVHLHELGDAAPAMSRCDVEAGAGRDDGDDARHVPARGQPRVSRARPLATGRVRRRAVPCDAGAARRAAEAPPTLVFDEVDAGIGGEAGRRGRSCSCRRSARGTRCCASRTWRRSRRSPMPRSWWRRPRNRGGSWTGAGQSARWRRDGGRR